MGPQMKENNHGAWDSHHRTGKSFKKLLTSQGAATRPSNTAEGPGAATRPLPSAMENAPQ
eukprot:1197090-Pleurochrysis_carterae.AAC.1